LIESGCTGSPTTSLKSARTSPTGGNLHITDVVLREVADPLLLGRDADAVAALWPHDALGCVDSHVHVDPGTTSPGDDVGDRQRAIEQEAHNEHRPFGGVGERRHVGNLDRLDPNLGQPFGPESDPPLGLAGAARYGRNARSISEHQDRLGGSQHVGTAACPFGSPKRLDVVAVAPHRLRYLRG
jgi:hypothetical protein